MRGQTIRVQITNAQPGDQEGRPARYMKAYNETVDWMYSSPRRCRAISPSPGCRSRGPAHAQGVHPEEEFADGDDLGLEERWKMPSGQPQPLRADQLKELIQIVPASAVDP